jgi:hypothetical protein
VAVRQVLIDSSEAAPLVAGAGLAGVAAVRLRAAALLRGGDRPPGLPLPLAPGRVATAYLGSVVTVAMRGAARLRRPIVDG